VNTAQSLLTLGALILVSVLSLNFYRQNNYVSGSLDNDRFRVEALSVLTSQVEQLSQYYFDEVSTDTGCYKRLEDMTAPLALGFEVNDSGLVDDIDDLRGMSLDQVGISGVIYRVNANVDYVTLSNSRFTASNQRQYHKRVTFSVCDRYNPPLIYHTVDDQHVRDTLRMSVIISYWFYN